MGGNQSY